MTNGRGPTRAEIPVYFGLGSNIGDRAANLREAVARIEKLGLEVVRRSSIYETEPVGFKDQPRFLNQVIEAKITAELTSKSRPVVGNTDAMLANEAEVLLSALLNIEREMGRVRTIANGPRVIDIDLLLFGDLIVGRSKEDGQPSLRTETDVVVPHPRMHERRFVLEPLCEIAPELVHPALKKTCRQILASLDDQSTVSLYHKGGG